MAPKSPSKTKKRTAKILVVDDEQDFRNAIALLLENLGYKVAQAGNGRQALAKARRSKFDLILLDIVMPGMSGIEVCRELRTKEKTSDVPIVVASGLDAKDALEECIMAGADDFLSKPIYPLELIVRVRSLLRVRNIENRDQRVEEYLKSLQALRSPSNN